VYTHEAVGEDATGEEAAELALDEAGDGALAGVRAGQEARELALDDPVEDALVGAAPRVARLASALDVGMGRGRCVLTHAIAPLPASYRERSASNGLGGVLSNGSESARSRSRCRRGFT
jgi:hypothetical protein